MTTDQPTTTGEAPTPTSVGTAYRDAVLRLAAADPATMPAARASALLMAQAARERAHVVRIDPATLPPVPAQPTGPDLLPCDACNAGPDEPCRPWCIARPDVDDVATLTADGRTDAARAIVRDELARIADELAALADALTAGGPESPEARAAHTAAAALRDALA